MKKRQKNHYSNSSLRRIRDRRGAQEIETICGSKNAYVIGEPVTCENCLRALISLLPEEYERVKPLRDEWGAII